MEQYMKKAIASNFDQRNKTLSEVPSKKRKFKMSMEDLICDKRFKDEDETENEWGQLIQLQPIQCLNQTQLVNKTFNSKMKPLKNLDEERVARSKIRNKQGGIRFARLMNDNKEN